MRSMKDLRPIYELPQLGLEVAERAQGGCIAYMPHDEEVSPVRSVRMHDTAACQNWDDAANPIPLQPARDLGFALKALHETVIDIRPQHLCDKATW